MVHASEGREGNAVFGTTGFLSLCVTYDDITATMPSCKHLYETQKFTLTERLMGDYSFCHHENFICESKKSGTCSGIRQSSWRAHYQCTKTKNSGDDPERKPRSATRMIDDDH